MSYYRSYKKSNSRLDCTLVLLSCYRNITLKDKSIKHFVNKRFIYPQKLTTKALKSSYF